MKDVAKSIITEYIQILPYKICIVNSKYIFLSFYNNSKMVVN